MKCCYCGAEISEAERFCRYCGTKQSAMPRPAPAPVPAPAPIPVPAPAPAPVPMAAPVAAPAPKAEAAAMMAAPDLEAPVVTPPVMQEPPKPAPAPQPIPQPVPQPVPQPAPVAPVPPVPPVPPVAPVPPVSSYMSFEAPGSHRPVIQLPTGRAWWKMILLGIITGFIYPVVITCKIVTELNIAASRYDGKRTMSYLGMCALGPITLYIYPIVWLHQLCNRIGDELRRRGINYKFSASTMWLWGVLGSLILVGPIIFLHKLMKSMNLINADFNEKG